MFYSGFHVRRTNFRKCRSPSVNFYCMADLQHCAFVTCEANGVVRPIHDQQCGRKVVGMCNLYSLTKGQDAIRALAKAMRDTTGNMPPLPDIFPDQVAPVVRVQSATTIPRDTDCTVPAPHLMVFHDRSRGCQRFDRSARASRNLR